MNDEKILLALDASGLGALGTSGKSGLLDETETTEEDDGGLETENNDESDKGSNDTSDGLGDAVVRVVVGLGGGTVTAGGGGVGCAGTAGAAAEVTPVLGVGNGELAHAGLEVVPRQGGLVLAKESKSLELVGGSCAVGKEEADVDVGGVGLGGSACGVQLKGHGGGVVDDAVEVWAGLGELCETKEGHESAVSTELGVELGGGLGAVDDGLERIEDLAGEDGAGDGANGLARVVGQVPFVDGGKVVEAVKGCVVDEVPGWDRSVVDLGDVDVVPDY